MAYQFWSCLQVGVNILMAQVGSFVPCDRASISVRDCIFARVGAGDCQVSSMAFAFKVSKFLELGLGVKCERIYVQLSVMLFINQLSFHLTLGNLFLQQLSVL